jgi:cytoskeletal protein RodZ
MRREARGASLEAVVRATRLTRTVLLALEEDRFEDLPAPVYVRGFLKIYAQFLHVDGDQVLDAYEAQVAMRRQLQDDREAAADTVAATLRMPSYLQQGDRKVRALTPATALLLAATAAIALVFVWSVQRKSKPTLAGRPAATAPTTAGAGVPAPETAPQPTAAVPESTSAPLPYERPRRGSQALPPLPGKAR